MQWSNTNGKDKSQYINVSGSPRVFTSQTAKVGANCQVRALVGAIGKRQFEVQITSASTERFIIGLDDGSSVLGPALYSIVGSSSAPNGCSLLISPAPGSCTISANGRLNVQSGLTNATYHQGDIFTVEFDTTVGTVTFYRTRADSTVKIGTTLIECTWMAGGAKALVGSITTGQTTTANFGMTPFARRLSEGYLAYGDPE
jgi:hypothetical protein